MKWKLWYTDYSSFSDNDGEWEDAPQRGVAMLVVSSDDLGCVYEAGLSCYLWWPGEPLPWNCDLFGLWDYLTEINHPDAGKPVAEINLDALGDKVKMGRMMNRAEWVRLTRRVETDPDMPPKTGTRPSVHTADEDDGRPRRFRQ